MWIIYILFGIVGGVISGLGMGGGTLLIPLISLLSLGQKQCQAINLISFILSASVVVVFHAKNGLIEKKNLFTITVPACLFSVLGSLIAIFVSGEFLKKIFGIFLLVIAIKELIELLNIGNSKKLHKKSKKIK